MISNQGSALVIFLSTALSLTARSTIHGFSFYSVTTFSRPSSQKSHTPRIIVSSTDDGDGDAGPSDTSFDWEDADSGGTGSTYGDAVDVGADNDDYSPSDTDEHSSALSATPTPPEAAKLKSKLLTLCASYDRGYGATPSARRRVDELVDQLTELNPTLYAAQGIEGDSADDDDVPLKGIWRMVWTTALDVLNLGASPITSVAAIYQNIDPPLAINIIDLVPRAQSLLPTNFPSSILRAEVQTRAYSRSNMPNRVGLVFEGVKLKPVEVLGMDAGALPPFGVNFPTIPGADGKSGPGYFDVLYLDEDMLIIKQNEPGGIFVSVKVEDCDP